jgi:hypothetical protein
MARIRRPKKINGSEYTFGGGSAAAAVAAAVGGLVKIAKGDENINNVNHDGFVANNSTVTVTLDVSTSIPTKDQYFYIDNAFESATGTFTYELMNGDTSLPSGISFSENNDDTDTDIGFARFYGTPNSVGTNSFKIKGTYPEGSPAEQVEIIYKLQVLTAGTTPVWPAGITDKIIRNTAEPQPIVGGPTTTYSGALYSLSNVSGFAAGVTPVIDPATGAVTVSNVGDIVAVASTHSFTVTADLGESGTVPHNYSGPISYGDPYGARYFGPANYKQNQQINLALSLGQEDEYHNPSKKSGALRRGWNVREDTSPYAHNDGFGCQPDNNYTPSASHYANTSGYNAFGKMGIHPTSTQIMSSSQNHPYVRGFWTVPAGVYTICAVAAGGGAMGPYTWANYGGGGGGLAWMNGIEVEPGEVLQWCWGLGRAMESANGSYGSGSTWLKRHSGGPNTDCIIFAQGGGWSGYTNDPPNNVNTSYTAGVTITGIDHWDKGSGYGYNSQRDGGGWGVNTSEGSAISDGDGNTFHYGGGAAHHAQNRSGTGAGGYRGNQQNGGSNQEGYYGGGGNGYDYSSTHGYGAGGGVGLDGQGSRGTHGDGLTPRNATQAGSGYPGNGGSWTSYNFGSPAYFGGGGGGSGGSRGGYGENQFTGGAENGNGNGHRIGGLHGGGGGGSGTSSGGGHGSCGGLRIIWGVGEDGTARSFPYTYCSEKPTMKYNGEH